MDCKQVGISESGHLWLDCRLAWSEAGEFEGQIFDANPATGYGFIETGLKAHGCIMILEEVISMLVCVL